MNRDEIVTLSLKLAGIFCLVLLIFYSSIFLGNLLSLIKAKSIEGILSAIFVIVIPFIIFASITYLLLFKTDLLSKKIFPSAIKSEPRSISSKEIQALAFSIMGVWILSSAIPDIFQIISSRMLVKAYPESAAAHQMTLTSISHVVSLIVRLLIGLYLFLGSKGLVNLWHKIQSSRATPS
ncbi:hypothetical protein JW926_00635 [Candidatus Sumerlaeota bacterium]|nr:hypothetical protein [Candidatus Sumerlaeota bacterium]